MQPAALSCLSCHLVQRRAAWEVIKMVNLRRISSDQLSCEKLANLFAGARRGASDDELYARDEHAHGASRKYLTRQNNAHLLLAIFVRAGGAGCTMLGSRHRPSRFGLTLTIAGKHLLYIALSRGFLQRPYRAHLSGEEMAAIFPLRARRHRMR